ncbi:MAG: BamA/TamA family outer membrane protein [Firmicutes bacterium]|nr:BamA/TamA family outer membrane protein [Bacillota bacterium]
MPAKILRLVACLLLLHFMTAGLVLANTHSSYEDYQSQLELEYFVPVITYDGSFYVATYAKMSSILRDQELKFVLLATEKDFFNFCLGYTLHAPYWSYGLNLYHMPIYTGPLWSAGFWELQRGVSLLASRHFTNEQRLDLRLQYENFTPLSQPSYPVDNAALFGFEATVTRDNFYFFAQSGRREYLSLGAAYPLLGADYQYIKAELDQRRYLPLGRFSLILATRAGKIWGDYPVHRGFALGGIQQVSMSSLGSLTNVGLLGTLADTVLRGYHEHRFCGDGFILGNLELRLLAWPSSYREIRGTAFSLLAFTDAALVWNDQNRLTASPSVGVGVGFKLFLYGLNLGLDYAVPLNTPGEHPKWHFSIGEVF